MANHTTIHEPTPALLCALLDLLWAHRSAFRQERTFRRAVALVVAELFSFARHTVTQALLALGLTDADWSPWYRLFSRRRVVEDSLARCLLRETLRHVPDDQPYVTGVDALQLPRSSQKMPGTSWLPAPRTAVFRRGIHRAQRFVHGAWLPPIEKGYTRAIPLRFVPAFPQKAVPALEPWRREWAAGLSYVTWLRGELDAAGRAGQTLLAIADASYDVAELWQGLPERSIGLIRTKRNRCLRALPLPQEGRGRPRKYGPQAKTPGEWLHEKTGWQQMDVLVRGRTHRLRYRVEGPFLRERAPNHPVWLVVVGGEMWVAGKRERRRKYRKPAFYLVSAVKKEGQWVLPLPIDDLLALMWQRWELEVAHREMKSGFGVGEKQCWGIRSAVVSVQWSVWVYAVLLLAGYRTWGWFGGPACPGRWWSGAPRWSVTTLLRGYRAAMWGASDFRACWTGTSDNWVKKDLWVAGLYNAVAGAARL